MTARLAAGMAVAAAAVGWAIYAVTSTTTVVASTAAAAVAIPAPAAAPSTANVAEPAVTSGDITPAVADAIRTALPLSVPVQGVEKKDLQNTFTDRRGSDRSHEAIDILAPRGTPVFAVDDGVVVKLFNSKPGGLTVYQFDGTRTVAYYYAHLDSYAANLVEGQRLKRGDPVGFVGSTGNANPAAPHLHFAVFELFPEKQWWKGRAINPLPLFLSN